MKSFALVLVLGVVALIGLTQAGKDYCKPSLCKTSETHIACNHSGDFATTCPKKREMWKMNSGLQKLIVDLHNELRNELAGGSLTEYPPASRMASMKWDPELADLARLHVQGCKFEHDQCHNTESFKSSGQNLGQTWTDDMNSPVPGIIQDLIQSWWDEHENANASLMKAYPKNWQGEVIGHFTAMARESNEAVGCAAYWMIDTGNDNMNSTMLTCNYATTNIIGKPVYDSGASASKCTTGKHPTYKKMCSDKEKY